MELRVSIITASFNSSKTINDAIKSVNNQTYSNIEHIFIDGNSSDKTIQIIQQNSKKENIIISEKDKGIYDAINKGIKLANGEIIGLLHSDDFFNSSDTIQMIVNEFERQKIDGVYGDLLYVSEKNTERIIRYWKSKIYSLKLIQKGWMPAHPTLFLKKEVYEKYGTYNINYRISADYDFILRILQDRTLRFSYLPEVITKMRIGGASNKNFNSVIDKMREDFIIIKSNNVGGLFILILKNLSKITQLFRRK